MCELRVFRSVFLLFLCVLLIDCLCVYVFVCLCLCVFCVCCVPYVLSFLFVCVGCLFAFVCVVCVFVFVRFVCVSFLILLGVPFCVVDCSFVLCV